MVILLIPCLKGILLFLPELSCVPCKVNPVLLGEMCGQVQTRKNPMVTIAYCMRTTRDFLEKIFLSTEMSPLGLTALISCKSKK
mgnify:CR=1 FL=1